MSMSILIGLLNLIIEGDFKEYYGNLKKNKFFVLLFIFFLLHVIALIWSENLDYGLNDLRRKLSLLAVPVIVLSKPISLSKSYRLVLFCFISAVLVTSVINAVSYFYYPELFSFKEIREMSRFNSHIRYGIMVAFGIPILLEMNNSKKGFYLIIPLIIWLLFYTYLSQVLTGIISIVTIVFAYVLYRLIVEKKIKSLLFLILTSFVGLGFLMNSLFSEPDYNTSNKADFISMKIEWEKKSDLAFEGLDNRDQNLKYTLSRFLESKNASKNGKGVRSLSIKEIKAIENGMANVSEMKIGFWGRVEGLKYQIHHTNDPNGHSLLQRIEAWKSGLDIFKDHPFVGVGTGDVDDAFTKKYNENNSKLLPVNQIRAHNTYLTTLLTFGVLGLILFITILFIYLKAQLQYGQILGFVFMTLMMVTFLFEDTLETQTGITLFAFFAALYSIQIPSKKND